MSGESLRFGVLGAAKITPDALIKPAAGSERAEVVAIAARDPERARAFAEEHGIAQVDASYEALVRNPDVDAVYNPLPASLHAEWTLEALRAGQARALREALRLQRIGGRADGRGGERERPGSPRGLSLSLSPARGSDPGSRRQRGARRDSRDRSGVLRSDSGHRRTFATTSRSVAVPPWTWAAIRSTGARLVTGAEPTVLGAEAREEPSGIDVTMTAELRFPEDVHCEVHCSMAADVGFQAFLQVTGSKGVLRADNPLVPHFGHRLRVTIDGNEKAEQIEGRTTYDHQLEAFVAAALDWRETAHRRPGRHRQHARHRRHLPGGRNAAEGNQRVAQWGRC